MLYEEGPGTVQDRRKDRPVVLLTPSNWRIKGVSDPSKFEFKVKLPSTGWECWDRWVATAGDTRREPVIADYFRQAALNRRAKVGEEKDLQLDDPAVQPRLVFILQKERNGVLHVLPDSRGLQIVNVPPESAPNANDLTRAQRLSISVTCRHLPNVPPNSTEGLNSNAAPNTIEVNAIEGEVYKLTICSAVPTTELGRFGARVLEELQIPDVSVPEVRLVSPTHLIIEAATAKLPDGQAIWANLKTKFTRSGDTWRLNATVDNATTNYRNVHRAEVDRQVWRWTGRPSTPHPELTQDFADEAAMRAEHRLWEAREFGERPDTDLVTHNMLSEKKPQIGERKFFFEELLGDATSGANKGLELRGLHFRFAVRLFSRYEELLPPDVPTSVESFVITSPVSANEQQITSRWKSQFVPCRHIEKLEAPKIKFMLPLTETLADHNSNSAGILIVLSEVWHQRGGIGESIQAEVSMTADPRVHPSVVQNFYFQVGPDPIVTASGRHETSHLDGDQTFSFKPLEGPIGHFYDLTNRSADFTNTSAFFVNTSFVLPAPVEKTATGFRTNFPWHFAKIRLRRTLQTRVPVTPAAATNGYAPNDATWKRTLLTSGYTDPVWVQFLPDFSIYDSVGIDPGRIVFSVDPGETAVFLKDAAGRPVVLRPFTSDRNSFELYLVLTKRVFDVTGRNDQEVYVRLFKRPNPTPVPDTGIWVPEVAPASLPDQEQPDYVARIIEVQRPPGVAPAGVLWDELFGNNSNPANDTRARIVRISRPIETKLRVNEPQCT